MKTHEVSGGVRVIIAMMHIPQSTAIDQKAVPPIFFFLKLGRSSTSYGVLRSCTATQRFLSRVRRDQDSQSDQPNSASVAKHRWRVASCTAANLQMVLNATSIKP